MAKPPGKSEDGIRNKLKNFLGLKGTKSASDQYGQVRQTQTDFVFTPEIIKVCIWFYIIEYVSIILNVAFMVLSFLNSLQFLHISE